MGNTWDRHTKLVEDDVNAHRHRDYPENEACQE